MLIFKFSVEHVFVSNVFEYIMSSDRMFFFFSFGLFQSHSFQDVEVSRTVRAIKRIHAILVNVAIHQLAWIITDFALKWHARHWRGINA